MSGFVKCSFHKIMWVSGRRLYSTTHHHHIFFVNQASFAQQLSHWSSQVSYFCNTASSLNDHISWLGQEYFSVK